MSIGFTAVHQLVRPLLPALDRLPEPQRHALGICFGLVSGPPAEQSRGGYSTVARLLERAAALTPDPTRRAERLLRSARAELSAGAVDRAGSLLAQATPRLRGPMSRGQAIRLEGRIQLAVGRGAEAASTLLRAARALQPLDPRAARESLLTAVEAVFYAGWSTHRPLPQEIAQAAAGLPAIEGADGSALDLLLQAYARRASSGYVAAVPAYRKAAGPCHRRAHLLPLALTIRGAFADVPRG